MGALDGVLVVDMTQWMQGPVSTAHLADMGATVIKIETPKGGDPGRGIVSTASIPVTEWNSFHYTNNRGKKSLAVDFHTEQGLKIVHQLVAKGDVFVTNLLRPSLVRAHLDYPSLREVNPRIIYARMSSYGRYGPDRDLGSFDLTGQARSGIMLALGEPGQAPVYPGLATGDVTGAQFAAWAIVLALLHRERTGEGQEVDSDLLGSIATTQAQYIQTYLATRSESLLRQRSRKDVTNALWNIYKTADRWVYLCVRDSQDNWSTFCCASGFPELAPDGRFDSLQKRREHARALVEVLDDLLITRPASEWLERWAKVKVPATSVQNFAEVAEDPQLWANDYIVEVDDPPYGCRKQRGATVQLSKTPGEIKFLGPEVGEHSEEILVDVLGYGWDDIVRLKEQQVIL